MKTITLSAWKRPDYTHEVLVSLIDTWRPGWCFMPFLDGLRSSDEWFKVNQTKNEIMAYSLGAPCDGLRASVTNLGCDRAIFEAVNGAFLAGSDFNLHLEDDTVPAPDLLDLADWFYNLPERDDYAALNCFSGWNDQLSRPLEMAEQFGFCPWGWAVTREAWQRWFLPEWNAKGGPDRRGWDWSMSLTIQRHGLKVLRPVLSRIRNIGRDGGTYETPEHWDSFFPNLPVSDGSHGTGFFIGMRLPVDYRVSKMDDWARDEIERQSREGKKP